MDVRLPNLGEGVDSGSVVTLFVKEGDVIAQGQTLLELENEKAVAPIPSPAAGRVAAIRVKPGDKISVGQVILSLTDSDAASTPPPAAAKPEPSHRQKPKPAPGPAAAPAPEEPSVSEEPVGEAGTRTSQRAGFPPPASPSIRRLAKDLGIDLTKVRGSEHGGRIVLPDLRAYIQRLQQIAFQQKKAPAPAPLAEAIDFAKWGPVSDRPISPVRQVISRRMAESWTTIPHVTQFDEADITALNELRKKHSAAYEAQGARLTLTLFVLRAVALVLKKHPIFNASLDEVSQKVVFKEYIHIGLAVDSEAGLLVPVIRDVDSKTVLQLSKEVQSVADKARDRKLSAEEMRGGSFTISNQGGIGSGHFTPIINKPEVAILGVGRGAIKAVVKKEQITPRLLLPLALSYDHRLIDGANAARFMVDLVAALEGFQESDLKL